MNMINSGYTEVALYFHAISHVPYNNYGYVRQLSALGHLGHTKLADLKKRLYSSNNTNSKLN
jgi:hypothetical protein